MAGRTRAHAVAREVAEADGGGATIGEGRNFRREFGAESGRGTNRAPFAFAQFDHAIVAEGDSVDLHILRPKFADGGGGADCFRSVEQRNRFAAETFEGFAAEGVEVRTDEFAHRALGAEDGDAAEVGIDKTKPETEERICDGVTGLARGVGGTVERMAAAHVTELHQRAEVVGQGAVAEAGGAGDAAVGGFAKRGHGVEDAVVVGDIPEFLAEEKLRFAGQRGAIAEEIDSEVLLDRAVAVEALEVGGEAAADEGKRGRCGEPAVAGPESRPS